MQKELHAVFRSIVLSIGLLASGEGSATEITGAGATFPARVYEKWATEYGAHSDFRLDYQAIGSGNGVRQIVSRIVDFGASDEPMSAEELSAKAMPQFPTLIGGIVPVVNIRGVAQGQLKMSGEVLADIYLGKITRWNDPRVVAENKGLQLPDEQIAVVQRLDESGSALAFTSYLSQVSKDWKHDVGAAKAVHWPVGVGAKGNDGVANYVGRLEGSIGFVEYGTVKQEGLAYVQLKNRDGYFVPPSETTLKAAASHAVWDPSRGFGTSLVNQPGAESWPITMTTFILLNNGQKSVERGKAVLAFFDWAFREGDQYTTSLGFVPLPEHVENLVREAWKAQVKDAAGNALWN